jgi:hypothetical protein
MAAAAAAVSGLLAVSCSASPASTAPGASAPAARPGTAAHPGGVISLTAISALRSLFNRADGHTRLVLILSPT